MIHRCYYNTGIKKIKEKKIIYPEGNKMSIICDPTIYTSRPDAARSAAEDKIYDLLEELGIGFWRIDHEAAMTIDDCGGIDALLGIPMCKNLFLCNRQET
jgi:Ala-tRNA(Pro) deacylase